MDQVHGFVLYALQTYHTCDPYLQPIRRSLSSFSKELYPLLAPYLDQVAQLAQSSSPIFSVGIFVLFVLILIQILNLVRRIVAFWVRLVFRLVFWAAVVLVISLVWQRGVGRTARELVDWAQQLSTVWWDEYQKYDGITQQPKGSFSGARYGESGSKMGNTGAKAGWR